MREFFRPFRRKLGVLLLALASALMTLWMRSFVRRDTITLNTITPLHRIVSAYGTVNWDKEAMIQWSNPWPTFFDSTSKMTDGFWVPSPEANGLWKRSFLGFEAGCGRKSEHGWKVERWAMPYWSIVLPLTLLSAWLLIGTYRPSDPAAGRRDARLSWVQNSETDRALRVTRPRVGGMRD